jgi:hypothetical protein
MCHVLFVTVSILGKKLKRFISVIVIGFTLKELEIV